MNIRKAQIRAYNAQSELTHALYVAAEYVEDGDPAIASWQQAQRILNEMELAGYSPRRWGTGLASRQETGDESPEQLEEYDNADCNQTPRGAPSRKEAPW